MRVSVSVIPNSKQIKVIFHQDRLKVWLKSPPVDGKANEELRLILRKILSVRKSSVEIVAGHAKKSKVVDIMGVTMEDMKKLLG